MKRKRIGYFILVFVAFVLAGCGSNSLQKQLDLGQKYLQTGSYEQALAAFQAAIEVDAKCEAAYLGAADAYVGLQNEEAALTLLETAYEKVAGDGIFEKAKKICLDYAQKLEQEGKPDAAIRWLERILKLREDEELRNLLEEVRKKITGDSVSAGQEKAESEVSEYIQELMALYGYFEQDDLDKVKEALRSDTYKQMVEGRTEPLHYIPDKQKGVAVYGNGFCYYGDFKNGLRDGVGSWIAVDLEVSDRDYTVMLDCYYYQGGWKGDAPNGHGKEESESASNYVQENYMVPEKTVSRVEVKGWYWNGDIHRVMFWEDGSSYVFDMTATDGVIDLLEYDDYGSAVAAYATEYDETGAVRTNHGCMMSWSGEKECFVLGKPET